jgi:hypothetical protein
MFTVNSGFMGNFKLGDNINYNLNVLELLYRTQRNTRNQDAAMLCKPIIIIIASVCEAVLSDLHFRIKWYTVEGVQNIAGNVADYVRDKHIDEFEKFIASAKKHNMLEDDSFGIYNDLEELRKLRNRVHIQNKKGYFEPDERNAFTVMRQQQSEKCLERLIKIVSRKYARASVMQGYVGNFKLPWDEHFPEA